MSLAMRNFDNDDFFAHFGLPLMKAGLMETGNNTYSRGIAIDVKEVCTASWMGRLDMFCRVFAIGGADVGYLPV